MPLPCFPTRGTTSSHCIPSCSHGGVRSNLEKKPPLQWKLKDQVPVPTPDPAWPNPIIFCEAQHLQLSTLRYPAFPPVCPLSDFSEPQTHWLPSPLNQTYLFFGICVESLVEARICRPAREYAALQGFWSLINVLEEAQCGRARIADELCNPPASILQRAVRLLRKNASPVKISKESLSTTKPNQNLLQFLR